MTTTNRQWRVARYPARGEAIGRENFTWTTEPVPAPAAGEFLVRTIALATSPAQRGYIDPVKQGFLDKVAIGDVMRGRGIGQVLASEHPDYQTGDIFVGSLGWQDFSIQRPRGAEFVYSTMTIEQPVRPLTTELGILGQAGATAYFGLRETAALRAGDRVLISAAAGGVGSCAGQIARILGAKTVAGICGSAAKCRWLTDELGFDAAFDYRTDDMDARIAEWFPDGIDVFFDNVGGDILNTALGRLATGARVAICGFISTDYSPEPVSGPINYRRLVATRSQMRGFVVFDYWERFAEARHDLAEWYRDGRLVNCEDVDAGLESMPDTLASLFSGANRGIKLCRVAPDPPRRAEQ